MKVITEKVVGAFLEHKKMRLSNTDTDGVTLNLFGNRIAEWRDGELWISNGGWSSQTTKERLNALPNVSIRMSKGQFYLNGEEWGGEWVRA